MIKKKIVPQIQLLNGNSRLQKISFTKNFFSRYYAFGKISSALRNNYNHGHT